MKKFYLISILFLAAATVEASDLFELRAGLGFNTSKLSPNPNGVKSNYAGGFLIGADLMYGKRLYINPGIYYFGMSSRLDSGNSSDDKIQFSKMKVPVLIGYKLIPLESMLNVRLFAGPSVSYVADIDSKDFPNLGKNDFNRGVWSANAGIGLDLLFLFLDAGYEIGMSNVFKDTNAHGSSKNNAFYAMAGLRLKL
jgi:hypothetical protein